MAWAFKDKEIQLFRDTITTYKVSLIWRWARWHCKCAVTVSVHERLFFFLTSMPLVLSLHRWINVPKDSNQTSKRSSGTSNQGCKPWITIASNWLVWQGVMAPNGMEQRPILQWNVFSSIPSYFVTHLQHRFLDHRFNLRLKTAMELIHNKGYRIQRHHVNSVTLTAQCCWLGSNSLNSMVPQRCSCVWKITCRYQ